MLYKQNAKEPYLTYEQMNIITNTQVLWARLGVLIRDLIYAVFRDPKRVQPTVDQLYNFLAVDFFNFFSFFYGSQKAQQFINYLSDFITNLWRLFEAISANNQEAVNLYTVEVYKAADQLSTFLASNNHYWSADQWKNFLYQYIRTIVDEVLALTSENFSQEYKLFEHLEQITMLIGDYMARGIISSSSASPINTN